VVCAALKPPRLTANDKSARQAGGQAARHNDWRRPAARSAAKTTPAVACTTSALSTLAAGCCGRGGQQSGRRLPAIAGRPLEIGTTFSPFPLFTFSSSRNWKPFGPGIRRLRLSAGSMMSRRAHKGCHMTGNMIIGERSARNPAIGPPSAPLSCGRRCSRLAG